MILLAATGLRAQSAIRVEVHNIVELSERFNVVFVVEGDHSPSDFQWEAGEDFNVIWGPQRGTSSSIQIINGKTTRSSQTSYTYILQARRTGTFTLAPATAKVRGDEIRSRAVSIQVVDDASSTARRGSPPVTSATPPSRTRPQGSTHGNRTAPADNADADIFMRLSLSRSSVVVGEPVTATLKIYHRANLVGFENARFPSFKGFWSQETEAPTNIEFQREQVGETVYNSAVMRRWVIIPQKSGDQTIDAAEIVCLVNQQRRSTGNSIFDDFFGNNYLTLRQRVSTAPVTLHVSALPGGAPASFSGGVGEYTVSAQLSKGTINTHDAASLTITVSGKGNVALLEAPKVKFPPDFEVYDIKTSVNTDKSGTSGSKTFEIPFIPRSPGEFNIGPVEYGYYDVKQRRYHTALTDTLRLNVLRSAQAGSSSQASGSTLVVDRKGVRTLGDDIRFIRTKTSLGAPAGFFTGQAWYWILAALMVLAAAGTWLGCRKMAARRQDVAGTRKRKATREALKRLAQAREFLQKNLYTAFYEELHRSLLGFVGDKLSMDMAEQNKENISAALMSRGVPEETAAGFVGLLDACEFARYSPDAGHDAMQTHYEQAVSLITSIDSSMKKSSVSGASASALAVLLLLLPFAAQAAGTSYPDSLWHAGVEAYSAGDYTTAAANWEGIVDTGLMSRELYFNLGNAYFKTGEMGPAILWYERALRLDPSDTDVRHNLEYARTLTQDRIDEVPEFFLKSWRRSACYLLPANVWAILGLALLAGTLALVLLFLLGSTSGRRRLGFFGGIVLLLLTLVAWDFSRTQREEAQRQDMAVVMRPVSSVKSSPSENSAKDLFILHEGTRVRILDNVSGYANIELADGRQGWIPSGDIEVI
jgi:tetratricopeptide (TPR) repeat protein